MTAFLEARGLCKSYGRPPRPVLRDIDLSLPRGSIWGLLGESGSFYKVTVAGKSGRKYS